MNNTHSQNRRKEQSQRTKLMNFVKNGQHIEVECEVVDLNSPEFDHLLKNAPLFRKSVEVRARQSNVKEKITTALDATESVAECGDWVVTNPGGETFKVEEELFRNNYSPKEGEKGIFISSGVPVKAVQINKNIVFKAPWGSYQGVRVKGYVVERQDNKERYGIEQEAFITTYKIIKEKKKKN